MGYRKDRIGVSAAGVVLRQGIWIYRLLSAQSQFVHADWTDLQVFADGEGDFRPISFFTASPPMPDFSSSGAPIQFGYSRTALTIEDPIFTQISGTDNLRVVVHPVPEPGLATLMAVGAVVGISTRRTKR